MADYGVDIYVDGEWMPVSTLESDGVTVSGGRQRDAGETESLMIRTTLRDDDGNLNPRNPRSELFGKIGQGTPMRVTWPETPHLWIPFPSYAVTPDHASLDLVGDLDIRIDVQMGSWAGSSGSMLLGKYNTTGNQRSWAATIDSGGFPFFRWSPDGTLANAESTLSDEAVTPDEDGRITLRFYLDVNNGGGGWTMRFYYAYDGVDSASWTQLGAGWIGTPTTSVYASTADLRVGYAQLVTGDQPVKAWGAQVRNGIGGPVVANPDFTLSEAGVPLVDSAGRTWTTALAAEYRAVDVRGVGELVKWPTRWNVTDTFKWAPVQARGISARLARPRTKVRSPLFREAIAATNLQYMVEYWPGEDSSESTSIGSGVTGGTAMQVAGEAQFGSSTRIPGSEPLLVLATGVTLTGQVRKHTATGTVSFRMVADIPTAGYGVSEVTLLELTMTGGSVKWWRLVITPTGQLSLRGYNALNVQVAPGANVNYDLFGRRQMIGFQVVQTGGDIYYQTFTRRIADDLTVSEVGFDGTFPGLTMGRTVLVKTAPQGNLDGGAVGHWMVGTSTSLAAGIDSAIVGNDGERAVTRLVRLCVEFGIRVRVIGEAADSPAMGPQPADTLKALLQESADVDGGVLYDARDELALEYRTRASLYNQTARVSLTYDAPGESPHLEPDEPGDDVVNDYTASRRGGSSLRAVVEEGPLSVQEFPEGVGTKDGSDEFNPETDAELFGLSWWAVHLGTWDEYRYPVVAFNLTRTAVLKGKVLLGKRVAAMRPGDRLLITNPPADLPPHPIDLLSQGWEETLRHRVRDFTLNCTPGRPWRVGVVGETVVDSDGTVLAVAIDDVDTVFTATVEGVPWAVDGDFPFTAVICHDNRESERIEVLSITGAGPTQTWTVTRGVDGWSGAHPAGSQIWLWEPLRFSR